MYRIDRSNRGNLRMRSQQNPTIYPGTQIVHEKPLIGLNVGLVDVLSDQENYMKPDNRNNCFDAL